MSGIADTPAKVGRPDGWRQVRWWSLLAAMVMAGGLAWGENFVHVGFVNGLDVQAAFRGYERVASNGDIVYQRGEPIAYRVQVRNRSPKPLNDVNIQSFLLSDGAACDGLDLHPGAPLPGAAASPIHRTTIEPGAAYEFEGVYVIPASLCPSSGNLRVRLHTARGDRTEGTAIVAPVHYRIAFGDPGR